MSCSPLCTKTTTGGVAAFQRLHICFEGQQRPSESDMKITRAVTTERGGGGSKNNVSFNLCISELHKN